MVGKRHSLLTSALKVKLIGNIVLFSLFIITTGCAPKAEAADSEPPGEPYGPPNLIRTMKTPFSTNAASSDDNADQPDSTRANKGEDGSASALAKKAEGLPEGAELPSISLTPAATPSLAERLHRSPTAKLNDKLITARIFLPERMVLGQATPFTIRAKPGSRLAIAMADRNAGAKPILGRNLRLGPDRKVVAVGRVSEAGVAEIYVETPIEGDLIGQYLYFEAAIWQKDDMSDMELAQTVSPAKPPAPPNGVLVAQQPNEKIHGVRIVPETSRPMGVQAPKSLSTGQP